MDTPAVPQAGAARSRRLLWCLLPLYPALALAGALTHRQGYAVAAVGLLLALVLWPGLSRARPLPWLCWLAMMSLVLGLALRGLATLALETVPILISGLIAWLFGRTLRAGRQPLIARLIEALEGAPRLALPGVARYARGLTWCWAALLGVQACVLALLLACAVPGGLLITLGIVPPLALPGRWALGGVQVGGYVVLVLAFAGEYLFRRWHFRHLPQLGLRELLVQTAARWPQLSRGAGKPAP